MTRRNAKTVLRTAVSRNATAFTLLNAAKVMMALFFMAFIACAKEDLKPHAQATVGPLPQDSTTLLIEHWSESVRSLLVNATAHDTLCLSWLDIQQHSLMQYSTEDGMIANVSFSPNASLVIRLTPPRQEVRSEAEIPTYRTNRKVVYDTPINDGLRLGRKFQFQDHQADGSVAEITGEWSCLGIITADGDTVLPPHFELTDVILDSIHCEKYGVHSDLDKPYKVEHCYTAVGVSKGTSKEDGKKMFMPSKAWRIKSITDVAEELISSRLEGKYVGCGETLHWEGVEYVKTNKREFTNPVNIPVVLNITAPEPREQPSNDSIFNEVSKGTFKENLFSENTNEDGATIRTKIGTQVSKNGGQENGTIIENTINFTYSYPTKYTSRWASYDIDSLKLSFAEGGFTISSVSEDEDYHVWMTTNTVIPTIGECELDAIDELVRIKVAKEKKAIIVDSVYVVNGHGDRYIVDKTWFWSDASTTTAQFVYDGWHSVSPVNFGEKIVSNLNWNASGLKANGSSTTEDKKEFSPTIRFEVVYTTSTVVASATNSIENGVFGFNKTAPIVTFIDGDTKIVCPERKLEVNGLGATPAKDYTIVVREGVSYKGYTYNYLANVAFDGDVEADVTSQGLLLMLADEAGDAVYTYEYEWVGNTIIVRTIVTIPHTFADDEVYVYETRYTVSMTDLADGRIDAENTSFAVTASNSENALEPVVDGFFTIQPRERAYTYVISNGAVERQMNNTITDAVIAFNDGKGGSHTWDASLTVTKSDSFGSAYDEGSYRVTPLTTTVTAVAQGTNAPTLTVSGTTDIYVEQDKIGDTSYKPEESWNGNTFTAKVTRTIKHTKANDEVKPFDKSVTVSMSDLQDGRVDAENTSFTVKPSNSEKSDDDKDGNWTVTKRVRSYTYVVSNGSASRQMTNEVVDYTIVFKDGDYTHTFNAQLTVSKDDKFGKAYDEGSYRVTPLTTTAKAVGTGTGAPTLTKAGVTSIYVQNIPVQYRLRGEFIEEYNENSYFNVYAEKSVDGGETWTEMDVMKGFVAERHGKWAPNVTAQVVTSYEFTTHDTTKSWALEEPQTGRGTNKRFDVINVSHIEYFWKSLFPAPLDADRNDKRNISGTQKQWVNKLIYHNPETGEPMTYEVDARLETTTHTVKDGVYTRIVSVYCQNQIVESQVGTVVLELVQ